MSVDTHMNISPVLGTDDNDKLIGTGRSEVMSGAGGDDLMYGLSGHDEIFGGSGDDTIYGQGGNDTIYGNGKPSFVDMNSLKMVETNTATVTFIDEGAGFRNALGVYEIDEEGNFGNVQILFANASKAGSGGDLVAGESSVDFEVNAGAQLGFFVVSNGHGKGFQNREALEAAEGTFELRQTSGDNGTIDGGPVTLWYIDEGGNAYEVKSQYGAATFHSTATESNDYALNADNFLHVVGRANAVSGDLLIGFEDLYNGGDRDYDDTIIQVHLGQQNIVAQLPVSSGNGIARSDDDTLYGGVGDDVIYGIGGDDMIAGGDGNDELFGNSGNDALYGNNGADSLNGHSGNDTLSGGAGNDRLDGGSGDDFLNGDSGNDVLVGGSGIDVLFGGSGDDKLSGNSGNDSLYGDNGDDLLLGNSGDDVLDGGGGSDELNGHSGADTLFGGSGGDKLIGGGGNDQLFGGENNDKLYGGSGTDALFGETGNDYLTGGSGDDLISGGLGSDKLFGGSGADTFLIGLGESGDRDIVGDFSANDFVDLTALDLGSFEDLMANATQENAHTVFSFEGDFSLRLNNFDLAEAEVDSFIL